MIYINLYFFLSFFLTDFPCISKNDIVVIGYAYNEKDGAWIASKSDNKNYYLEGFKDWDSKIVGKKVKVWGKLVLKKNEITKLKTSKIGPPMPIPQQRQAKTIRIIVDAKWQLIK